MENQSSLLPLIKRYFDKDAVDAAHGLEAMDEEVALEVLNALPAKMSANVMQHLPNSLASQLLTQLPPNLFGEIVEQFEAQQGADIFLSLPKVNRETFLQHLSMEKKRQIQELLTYPEDSAGCIMTAHFIAFHSDLKVREVIEKIRQMSHKKSSLSYAYVIDKESLLVGVLNMRDLLLADEETLLEAVMIKNPYAVNCFMDRERVADELNTRKLFASPVVDANHRLLGVVKAESLIADVQEEATEDFQKMFGVSSDERPFSPFHLSLKARLPWLHVNLATAFLAASVVSLFEDVIAKITVLAVYLPVVAGQGGNAGAQSMAVVMRGLVMREIPRSKIKNLLFKETCIGLINGVTIGLVTALIAWLWQGNPYLGLVIGLGMIVNLAVAGLSGAAIPLTMKAIGLDPAQCSNIILTTITDIVGFFSFLSFAVLFQDLLV